MTIVFHVVSTDACKVRSDGRNSSEQVGYHPDLMLLKNEFFLFQKTVDLEVSYEFHEICEIGP